MVRVWTKFTDLSPEKQGAVIFLSLNWEVFDAALELEEEVISGKDGVKSIMARLDKIYKKDDTLSKFHALEYFETYKRPSTLSIPEYINECEKRLHKVKNYELWSRDVRRYLSLPSPEECQLKERSN